MWVGNVLNFLSQFFECFPNLLIVDSIGASEVGGQGVAAGGKSVLYIMSYGRWRCVDSVLRYVTTPEFIRTMDAKQMATAVVDAPWGHIEATIRSHYDGLPAQDKLWAAPAMLATTVARDIAA